MIAMKAILFLLFFVRKYSSMSIVSHSFRCIKVKESVDNIPERSWTKVPAVEPWWIDVDRNIDTLQFAEFTYGLWGLKSIPVPNIKEPVEGDNHVRVNLYEIGGSMTNLLSKSCCKKLPLIPHMGVRIYGREYFFSNRIESRASSGMDMMLPPEKFSSISFDFGITNRSIESINGWLDEASQRYNRKTYDLWNRNCNHFAEEFSAFLLPELGIPAAILDPILDVTESMLDSVPSWRRSIGETFMNDISRIVLMCWGAIVKDEKKLR